MPIEQGLLFVLLRVEILLKKLHEIFFCFNLKLWLNCFLKSLSHAPFSLKIFKAALTL